MERGEMEGGDGEEDAVSSRKKSPTMSPFYHPSLSTLILFSLTSLGV